MLKLIGSMAIVFGWVLFSAAMAAEPAPFSSQLLFDSGKEGYPRYRIPALIVTPAGTVLAICEGRKDGRGLTGNIDLILKRSTDSGRTWSAIEVIADDGPHTLGNPCPVIDRDTGTLWLALTRSYGSDIEQDIVAGRTQQTTRVLITYSTDDGRTWSPPRDITDATKADDWTWYGTGPGIGIQLRSGRLVIPSYHAERETMEYRSHMIYSDNHGQTWNRGQTVGHHTSECQVAQRQDDTLVLSARTISDAKRRTIATSRDGGEMWSTPTFDRVLYDPACQAALYRLPSLATDGRPLWLYSHPAGPDGRRNLTVRLSRDEGQTWPIAKQIRAGDSQYSCLAQLPDGSIGCLHESWVDNNYRLFFIRFSLAWLDTPASNK